jgi:hypothetical protein
MKQGDKVLIIPFNLETTIIKKEGENHYKVEKYGFYRRDLLKQIKETQC